MSPTPHSAPGRIAGLAALACALMLPACAQFEGAGRPVVTARVADAALASGDPDMALRVAELVLLRSPTDIPALLARGDALYAMGRMDAAAAAYRAALAVNPRTAAAELGLGRTLIRRDPEAAEAAFRAAAMLEPGNALALNNLGIARDMLGRHAEAQSAYRAALAVAPEMTELQVNLGLSLALSGDPREAVRLLRPLESFPTATPIWRRDLAAALTLAGETAEANQVLLRQSGDAPPRTAVADAAPAPAPGADEAPLPIRAAPRTPVQRVAALPAPSAPAVAAQPAPQADPPPAEAVRSHRSAQLASTRTPKGAAAEWRRLRVRMPDLLGPQSPSISEVTLHGRTRWRLRTGDFASTEDVQSFCRRVRAQGAGCWAL